MAIAKILLLQGANMNWLGIREPEKYGTTTAAELDELLLRHAKEKNCALEIFYSNSEGAVIDKLYQAEQEGFDAAIMNPGGFCYVGYALRDCLRGIKLPVIEIHMTNHYARQIESVTASAARGVFMGLGIETYVHALDAAVGLAVAK